MSSRLATPVAASASRQVRYWSPCGRVRRVAMSPIAQALPRARIDSRSLSIRDRVLAKHSRSSSALAENSFKVAFGSSIFRVTRASVTGTSCCLADLSTTGWTTPLSDRPDWRIAASYNSCAAKIGRHFSTPPSRPM